MRIDLHIRDVIETLQAIIRGLDNRLTASENFAPEGTKGTFLTSNGDKIPPSYGGSPADPIIDMENVDIVPADATAPTDLPETIVAVTGLTIKVNELVVQVNELSLKVNEILTMLREKGVILP